jgi:rfaE bifunctional protein kinase chain/domain
MVSKVIRLSELVVEGDVDRFQGASLCFGHFNAIHPGHIRYFQTANRHGNQLVIALEGTNQLPESERNVVFSEVDRAEALAALSIVDYVVILDTAPLENLVQLIEPRALVLGKEFERERYTKVDSAVRWMREHGGEVVYEAGETHYATADIFGTPTELEKERWEKFGNALKTQNIDLSKVLDELSGNSSPRILVLGDTIVDQYVACDPIGMSNEAPVVVVKEIETKDFVGGAGIVAAHVAALGGDCRYLSVTGKDSYATFVQSKLTEFGVETCLIEDSSRPTTFKIRYLVEKQKLFRVSRLKEHSLPRKIEESVIESINEFAPNLDGILVCDFVYGVITPRIIDALEQVTRRYHVPLFGDLQCSSQIGNISKFRNYQLLCPTEREARIALGNQSDGIEYVANLLMKEAQTSNLIVKLGAEGFIAYKQEEESGFLHRQHFPALSVNPADVAGAGDALLAAVSVGLTQNLTLMEASAIGCCAAALAVQTVGNRPVLLEDIGNFVDQVSAVTDAI